ncbi:Aldo/keto reductase, partial [Linderina pennispora]
LTLNTGAKMPIIGFGTWLGKNDILAKVVEEAIRAGYRHIDTAWMYDTEAAVGEGIRNSGIARSEIFVTTKLWNSFHRPEDVATGLSESLAKLGLDYIDLYLMHGPLCVSEPVAHTDGIHESDLQIDVVDTYRAMEKLLETGRVKAIGVSNFSAARLEHLLANTTVVPAVNQVELHPYLPQPKLVEFCQSKGITITGHSPLGSIAKFNLREDPVINEIARERGVSAAQVLLAWGVKRGYSVIPKTNCQERLVENFERIEITDEDFSRINGITFRARF